MSVRMARKDFRLPSERMYKFAPLSAETEGKADGEDLYPVTLSDGSVDRHGDTVNPTGWDLAGFHKNPVLLWAHDSSSPPIGQVVNVRSEGPALRGSMQFAKTAFAQEIKALVDARMIRTVSVGFMPIEYKVAEDRDDGESWFPPLDFQKQELLELSVVGVPANPNALIDARSAGLATARIEAWAELMLTRTRGAGSWAPLDGANGLLVRRDMAALQRGEQDADAEPTEEEIAECARAAADAALSALRMKTTGRIG